MNKEKIALIKEKQKRDAVFTRLELLEKRLKKNDTKTKNN